MKTIIVDVDDVILDMVPSWLKKYNLECDDDLNLDDIWNWNIRDFIKPEHVARFFDYLDDPELYAHMPPIPGAMTAIEILKQKYIVIFATANSNPGQKYRLYELEFLDGAMHVVAEHKQYLRGDVIIDDKPETIKNFPGFAIVFDRPWNRDFDWPFRAHNWGEALNMIETLTNVVIPGLGRDVPIIANEKGGTQSKLEYHFDLVDPLTMFVLAQVLAEGARTHGLWNWRRISERDNINHALAHIYAHLAGDTQDDHLGHAFCRLMFALSLHLTPGDCPYMIPERVNDA